MLDILKEKYAYVFEIKLLEGIAAIGRLKKVEAGITLMDVGEKIEYMPLLLSGSIKIMREDEKGSELLLYHLEVGDTCAMTLTCCLRNTKSKIRAVTEQDTVLVMIPVQKMAEWVVKYKTWRAFVFESYNTRLNEMLEAIDSLAFHKMDERLYKYLVDKSLVMQNPKLAINQYEIANDLNTSRVVISRLLKKLEQEGKVKHQRNEIEVFRLVKK